MGGDMKDWPKTYTDPAYDELDSGTESRLGIPPGLINAIRTKGERSNNDQVSSAGAKTVYQITPTTRDLILKKYGVDAYLSPAAASHAAGLLLKEGLDRNKGDITQAVGEYIGGTDRKNWGKVTNQYIARVTEGFGGGGGDGGGAGGGGGDAVDSALAQAQAAIGQMSQAPAQQQSAPDMAKVHQAYLSGEMSPEDAQKYVADVNAGVVMLPRGQSLKPEDIQAPEKKPIVAPFSVKMAYETGKMTPEDAAAYKADLDAGILTFEEPKTAQEKTFAMSTRQKIGAARDVSIPEWLAGAGELALQGVSSIPSAVMDVGNRLENITQGLPAGAPNPRAQAPFQQAMQGLAYEPRTMAGQLLGQGLGAVYEKGTDVAGQALAAPVSGVASMLPGGGTFAEEQARRAPAATEAMRIPLDVAGLATGTRQLGAQVARAPAAVSRATQAAAAPIRERISPRPIQVPERAQIAPEPAVAQAPRVAPEPAVTEPGAPITPETVTRNVTILDELGLDRNRQRQGVQSGSAVMKFDEQEVSKRAGGEQMMEQFAYEGQKLREYADETIRRTGGTPELGPEARGAAIMQPLEEAQAAYKQRTNDLYRQANEVAAQSGPVKYDALQGVLDKNSLFATQEAQSLRRGVRSWLKEQNIDGMNMNPEQAQRLREYINSQWDRKNAGAVRELRDVIDDTTAKVLGEDAYAQAKQARAQYGRLFEDPKSVAKLLDIDGPEGINRSVSLEQVPKYFADLAMKDAAQFRRALTLLETQMPEGMGAAGKQAAAEARAAVVARVLDRNLINAQDGTPTFQMAPRQLEKSMAQMQGKLRSIVGDEVAQRLDTLTKGARMLQPISQNPSGTASAVANIMGLPGAGLRALGRGQGVMEAGGAAIGTAIGGIPGAAAGAGIGRALSGANQERVLRKMVKRSLEDMPTTKQKRF